eukprot:3473000-Heterocapsa_arctica.AAC.1
MIFSVGDDVIAIAVYVPEEKQHERNCKGWLAHVLGFVPCCQIMVDDREVCIVQIKWNIGGNTELFVNKGIAVPGRDPHPRAQAGARRGT